VQIANDELDIPVDVIFDEIPSTAAAAIEPEAQPEEQRDPRVRVLEGLLRQVRERKRVLH
jgi:hypothetical protein